ncbi:hypothetical protein DPMN_064972 [Dreissena polymorpha]|uniref:Uncharacterized protein n=1 Tax=Dreissena polymorpha TaxID=45954 RepID=A0A9D4CEL3_DREPO|nr:hypothetical protein DPMN_064972 [Dreissena polymorpha]
MVLYSGVGAAPSVSPPWQACLQLRFRLCLHGQGSIEAQQCYGLTGGKYVPAAVLLWPLMVLLRGTVGLTVSLRGRQCFFLVHPAQSDDVLLTEEPGPQLCRWSFVHLLGLPRRKRFLLGMLCTPRLQRF